MWGTFTETLVYVKTLMATIHFSPFMGEWFIDFLFNHGIFRSKKEHFVHSYIHLAITGESSTHSFHSRE